MSDETPTRHRVLVADDDAATRHGISRLLEKAGFEVAEAADGIAALNAIQEKSLTSFSWTSGCLTFRGLRCWSAFAWGQVDLKLS